MKRSRLSTVIQWTMAGLAAVLCVVVTCSFSGAGWAGSLPSFGNVAAVFDGDTVLLDSGHKVRYLGIDAPEVAHENKPGDCFGEEAKKANGDWVLKKRVTLKYETEKVDSYGRLLAFVFLPDGRCVNAEMIVRGTLVSFVPRYPTLA